MGNLKLYLFLLASITVMLFLSLGGGIWGAEQSIGHWTGTLFQSVCHQNSERSLSFMGSPMAVNSRCFGVFLGLWVGWMLIPIFLKRKLQRKWVLAVLLFAVMLQIFDYSGNLIGAWTNTNISRVVLGGILGLSVSAAISGLFKNSIKTE